jgi:hypothetical protein
VRAVLTVRVEAGSARAELARGGRVLWAAESAFATPEELRDAITQLVAGDFMPARAGLLRVELGPSLAQLRTLHQLPPVRRRDLKALVAMQAARFFRRNGSALVTDAAWRDGRRGGVAFAAAAEEPWIAAILDGAAAGGCEVKTIVPAGATDGARLELLSEAEQRKRRRRERLALGRLAGVAAAAWVAAGAVWATRFERERRSVEREIERLRSPAAAVTGARRALANAAELVDSVDRAGHERRRVLGRIAALSVALPDSAYATSLAMDSTGGGDLAVVARRSAEVTAALEQVRGIASPRIEGTVLRESSGGREWEHFAIRFEAAR